jgi:hypothetical protein
MTPSTSRVEFLTSEIRRLCQFPTIKSQNYSDKDIWESLYVCLDTIEDSELAIQHYLSLPEFGAFSGGYLHIYGVIQALFVQQDAIKNLYRVLIEGAKNIDKNKEWLNEKSPELYRIREIRNDIIGHPTRRNGKEFCYLTRINLHKNNFEYLKTNKNQEKHSYHHIDLICDIQIQNSETIKILEEIKNSLGSRIVDIKEKFKYDKLTNNFDDNHYQFGKLYSCSDRDFANRMYSSVVESIQKIQSGIIERYGSIELEDHLRSTFEKFEHIFKILNQVIINPINPNDEAYDPDQYWQKEIYLESLEKEIKALKESCEEIDKDFEI